MLSCSNQQKQDQQRPVSLTDNIACMIMHQHAIKSVSACSFWSLWSHLCFYTVSGFLALQLTPTLMAATSLKNSSICLSLAAFCCGGAGPASRSAAEYSRLEGVSSLCRRTTHQRLRRVCYASNAQCCQVGDLQNSK